VSADTDIAIVGGGPVGAALALALRDSGLQVTVLEARSEPASDPRPIALSHGSRLLLERLDVWQAIAQTASPTPIHSIHVSQRGGFGRVAINAADTGVPALGYVLDYHAVAAALAHAAKIATGTNEAYREGARVTALHRDGETQHITYTRDGIAATLSARLVVVADGGDIEGLAPLKSVDYAQHALTARVRTALPHKHVAYERFTPEGPLALLPFNAEMALVWTLTPARAAALNDADEKSFLIALREAFGARLGDFTAVTQRACYPLTLRYTTGHAAPGAITIGNAAQTLHPVAGQGFNLGLRDAWELAQRLRTMPAQALANPDITNEATRAYRARRRFDRTATVAATHGLVRLFSNDFFPANVLRGAGMTLLGSIAPARDLLARRMIFGARG
jgi:2-octaprenyl-6-methoxyphenol hydroxylase